MSYKVKKAAVLGSGVMGSGIACHLANVGIDVLMLDIQPNDKSIKNKNIIVNFIIYSFCKTLFFIFKPFKSNEVAQTPEDNGYYYSIPDTLIYPLGKINFENSMYPAPRDVHNYLIKMYGENYITPPPENTRISHARIILPDTPYQNAEY